MRGVVILAIAAAVLGGCTKPMPAGERLSASGYVHWNDRVRALAYNWGIPGFRVPCEEDRVERGMRVIGSLPTDECERVTAPQRWHGLWRDYWEGQQFCDPPARRCPDGRRVFISPEIDRKAIGMDDIPPDGLYEIEFIGRRTIVPQPWQVSAAPSQEMIVDRLISIRQVEPPSKVTMQPDQLQAYRRHCARIAGCLMDWEAAK